MFLNLLVLLATTANAEPKSLDKEWVKNCGEAVVRLSIELHGQPEGNGTGFFIASNGVLVTNAHVIENVRGELFAILRDGKRRRVVGSLAVDEKRDLALLKVEGEGFPLLKLAEDSVIQVGLPVYLIGSPFGLDQSLGVGSISAIRADFPKEFAKHNEKETSGPILQHSAVAGPGASGSPLMNEECEVMGIHHSGMPGSQVLFGAHVESLRTLMSSVNGSTQPQPLGPKTGRNWLISLGILTVGLAMGPLRKKWLARRASLPPQWKS